MPKLYSSLAFACFMAVTTSLPAQSQSVADDTAKMKVAFDALKKSANERDFYLARVLRKTRWATTGRVLSGLQRVAGPDGVATPEDFLRQSRKNLINRKVVLMQQFLRMDTNWDGVITQDEVTQHFNSPTPRYRALRKNAFSKKFARVDVNQDNQITMKELREAPDDRRNPRAYQIARNPGNLIALDANNDGNVTFSEAETIAGEFFDRFDKDGNWILTGDEWKEARRVKRQSLKAKFRKKKEN